MFKDILKDDGFFSGLDPLARIDLSDAVLDMGEYLDRLYQKKRLNTHFGAVAGRMAYFAPCHQREQDIGAPYEKLLRLLPGLTIVHKFHPGSGLDSPATHYYNPFCHLAKHKIEVTHGSYYRDHQGPFR